MTSQSRFSSMASIITKLHSRASLLLRRHRLAVSVERGLQRMPRQRRALHARGKLRDTAKRCQLAELRMTFIAALAGSKADKSMKQVSRLAYGFALQVLRHHRR